jgi:TPR repeat protein
VPAAAAVPPMRVSRCAHEWETDEFAASEEAAALYLRAYEMCTGDPPAYEVALDIFKQAVAAGSPRAAYALASWYLPPGRIVEPDFEEARRLLLIAAKADIPEAHWDLAIMYKKGEGVDANVRTAHEWYLRAAIRGDRHAVYQMGIAYAYGEGVAADRTIADIWLDRAEELGLDPETGDPITTGSPPATSLR